VEQVEIIAFLIIILTLVVNAIVLVRQRAPMRRMAALEMLPRIIGEGIEANRPLHISFGSATIGDETTMLALVSSEFVYYLAREVAVGDAAPLFTVSQGVMVPLAADTLRRAYRDENRISHFSEASVRWYPTGRRSLAFAAALMTLQADDQVSGNVIIGRHGLELALILDAAYRHGRKTLAMSEQLDGQAIAYGMADEALIGEELFAVAAYADEGLTLNKRTVVIDWMRLLLVASMFGIVIYNFIGGN
jgi:uncharacterized protein DUF6754